MIAATMAGWRRSKICDYLSAITEAVESHSCAMRQPGLRCRRRVRLAQRVEMLSVLIVSAWNEGADGAGEEAKAGFLG